MRRIPPALVVVIVVICGLGLLVLLTHPVVVLPSLTITLPGSLVANANPALANIQTVTVTLRTNGTLSVGVDSHPLAVLTYTPDTLGTAANLAMRTALPWSNGALLLLVPLLMFPWIAPQLLWSALITGVSLYYVLPIELTLRFVRG